LKGTAPRKFGGGAIAISGYLSSMKAFGDRENMRPTGLDV